MIKTNPLRRVFLRPEKSMPITAQLLQILPCAGKRAGVFVPVLNTAMQRYQIVDTKRVAAFIAQIGHESGQLIYIRELWGGYSGSGEL
jgi:putative chitinase